MSTSLKRTGISPYTAMVAAIAKPADWNPETLLIRFVEQNGYSTVFVVSGAALDDFKACEQWRIYDMQIPGKCLRQQASMKRFGVRNLYEVVMKFPCSLKASAAVWPLQFPYEFIDWNLLNTLSDGDTFDMCGKVVSVPVSESTGTLSKLIVRLSCKGFIQDVQLLGQHANADLKVGDVVALGGLRINTWKELKKIQTLFLTVVEVNPSKGNCPDLDSESEMEGPKRKALKIGGPSPITVAEALRLKAAALEAVREGRAAAPWDFALTGYCTRLSNAFFEADAPLVETATREVMCWRTELREEPNSIPVTMWDQACGIIFGVNAKGLRDLWEAGVEDAQKRDDILKQLNANATKKVYCICSGVVREYGQQVKQYNLQISVNQLELHAD